MSIWALVRVVANLLGTGAFLWFAWRSIATGMPAGNPKMNPRRNERPVQFWLIVAFYLLFAAGFAVRAAGL